MDVCVYLPPEWSYGLQRLPILNYFNAMEWEGRFAVRLKATKNTEDFKKCFKEKLFRIKFPTKNSLNAYLLSPSEVELGSSKNYHFWNIIMYWNGKIDSLQGWILLQSTDCIEKCFDQKLYKIKFPTKTLAGAYLYLPKEWSWGTPKICYF